MTEEGAYLVQCIKDRCEIDEEGGCWDWTLHTVRGVPNWRRHDAKGGRVRVLLWEAIHGVTCTTNDRIHSKCGDPLCVAPDHLVRTTRGALQRGKRASLAKVAAIAQKARARSPLDWDKVRAIRASDETLTVLAARYGVTFHCISLIRLHKSWRELSSPFAGLGATAGMAAR